MTPDKEATLKKAMLFESNFRFTMPFHKFIYEAMDEFSASQNEELRKENEYLDKRFNQVSKHCLELQSTIDEKNKEIEEWKNKDDQQCKVYNEAMKEIERLKGLISQMYEFIESKQYNSPAVSKNNWMKFKQANNL